MRQRGYEQGTGGAMRAYYSDLKDGVPVRDRQGVAFSPPGAAIAHSKDLPQRLRAKNRPSVCD
jgi:hypothetical protein